MEMCGLVRPPRGVLASKIYFLREKIDSHRWPFVCREWNLLRRHAVRAAHTAHRLSTAIFGGYGAMEVKQSAIDEDHHVESTPRYLSWRWV